MPELHRQTEDETPLDRLRALILADEPLQQRLIRLYDPADLVAAALEIAAAADIALDAETLCAVLHPDPLDIARFTPRPATALDWPGRHYLPAAVSPGAPEPVVDWINVAGRRLTDPFYADTIRRGRGLPLNLLLRPRTPLALLGARAPADGRRVPDGFVFHMSRCGSTLVAQMLAADPATIVASEPAPLDQVVQLLRAHPEMPMAQQVELLRGVVGALGRDRFGDARHFVVKLDCWHTLALPLLRHAFPDTPWIYLYRDPLEVLVSHQRMPGSQVVAGMMPDLFDIADPEQLDPLDHAATVLAQVGGAVIEHFGLGGGLLINYTALPEAVEAQILPHFGIAPDSDGLAAIRAAGVRDAKVPGTAFVADTADKRREATPAAHAAARIVVESYARIEAMRLS